MTVELSKIEIELLVKALTTAQTRKEDEALAYLLASRLQRLIS